MALVVIAEAAWVSVVGGFIQEVRLQAPVLGIPILAMFVTFGLVAARSVGVRLGPVGAGRPGPECVLAGAIGWLLAPEARAALAAGDLATAIGQNPGGWVAGLAVLRGFANATFPVTDSTCARMLRLGIPGLALIALIGGAVVEPWRAIFLADTLVAAVVFVACGTFAARSRGSRPSAPTCRGLAAQPAVGGSPPRHGRWSRRSGRSCSPGDRCGPLIPVVLGPRSFPSSSPAWRSARSAARSGSSRSLGRCGPRLRGRVRVHLEPATTPATGGAGRPPPPRPTRTPPSSSAWAGSGSSWRSSRCYPHAPLDAPDRRRSRRTRTRSARSIAATADLGPSPLEGAVGGPPRSTRSRPTSH